MSAVQLPAFGLLLRRHRNAAGMTQEDLAERAGMSVRGIGDLERGIRQPRRDTLRILLDALQLAPEEESKLEAAARTRPSGLLQSGPLLETGSFLGSLPLGRLVARHHETHRVLATLDVVVGGHGRLMLLTGEPGIGKTRVTQEAAAEAMRRGFLLATGRCYEPEQDVPFHPFVEALTAAYAALPRKSRDEIPSRWPYLGALLPADVVELPSSAGSAVGGLEGQQRLFRAVSGFLSAIAEDTPVAILLDDLHWADDASLKLLMHLARHTSSSRVLLLGTYRDVDLDARHPLERALVDLNRERLVDRVVLHRLDCEGTSELIAESLGAEVVGLSELAEMVHKATDGNPFFIQEILRMLQGNGDLYEVDDRWYFRDIQEIPPPETVRAAIQQRLRGLPGATAGTLGEASVLGQTFTFDELMDLGRRSDDELEEALEAAVGAGLIRETGYGAYAFNHVLTQQALYVGLSQRRRQRLHLAAGEALARGTEPVRVKRAAELARHFRAGGNFEQAVAYSMMAGERAEALFAYEDAQQHFRNAVELTSIPTWEPSDLSLRPTALARLGRVLDIGEKYDEALAVLEMAAGGYRTLGARESEAMCVAEIGWIHHNLRTDEQGIERIRPLVAAVLEEPPSPGRDRMVAMLQTALARLFFGLGRYLEELEAADCAAEAARDLGDDMLLAVAEARRGAALMTLGRPDEAREVLKLAITLAEATGNLGTLSAALANLAAIACRSGDYRQGQREYERAVTVAEQTGLPSRIGWTLVNLGRHLLQMGRWQQARLTLERSAQLFEDDDRLAVYPSVYLAQLSIWTGDSQRAVAEIESATLVAANRRDRWMLHHGSRLLAEHDLISGRPMMARDRLNPLVGEGIECDTHMILLIAPLAWAHLDVDDEDSAERMLAKGMELAIQRRHTIARVDLLNVQGMLLTRQERWEEAQHSLQAAIDLAHGMPDPYREAKSRAEMGVLARSMRDETAARAHGQEALSILQSIGATAYARYVERRLTGIGMSSEPRIHG